MNLIIKLLVFILYCNLGLPETINTKFDSQTHIIGTWTTVPNANEISGQKIDRNRPKFEITIRKDTILISRTHIGSWGYKQLLTYKFSGDTITAKEREYMSFDQNIGTLTSHFKYRNKIVRLLVKHDKGKSVMNLDPLEPGAVLSKTSKDTTATYNFPEQLIKWRISKDFKCDDKKNGQPITSVTDAQLPSKK